MKATFRTLAVVVFGVIVTHALWGCSSGDQTEIVLRGPLEPTAWAEVVASAPVGATTLRISSEGGSEETALDIAEFVVENEMDVVVDGVCLGACALYIFAAGQRKQIETRSVVACGENIIAATMIDADAYGSAFSAQERARADRARNLLRARGVSENFALNCWNAIIPLCVATLAGEDHPRRVVASADRYWVPTDEDFESFGLRNVIGAPTAVGSTNDQFPALPSGSWSLGRRLPEDYLRDQIPALVRRSPCDETRLPFARPV
jgi:hypothetical protein